MQELQSVESTINFFTGKTFFFLSGLICQQLLLNFRASKPKFMRKRPLLLSFIVPFAFTSLTAYSQCVDITCPTDITVYPDNGSCTATVNYSPPSGINPCMPDSIVYAYAGAIDTFTVPAGVTSVHIRAYGAQGGSATTIGGRGAYMSGDFAVSPGDQFKVLVGQLGQTDYGYGGGGGSFVATLGNSPVIVAGGGGGAEHNDNFPGYDALITEGGMDVESSLGGTNGNGGQLGSPNTSGCGWSGSGGGGFYTNGDVSGDGGGDAFVNGGAGGVDPTGNCVNGGLGGFGGGGAGGNAGGGGGGYSGGAGGANIGLVPNRGGGGGGSYNAGTNQVNLAGVNYGNGSIVISWAGTTADITTTQEQGIGSGGAFPIGVTTESYVAYNTTGDSVMCSFTVTVLDTVTPQFSGTVADTALCGFEVYDIAPPAVIDNCSNTVTYVLSGATTGSGTGDVSGTTFNAGVTTVTYTVTDESGNSASTSFNVDVYGLPAVTASAASDSACIQQNSLALTGTPAGGTWSGPAITGSVFDPAAAGTGTYNLVYSYESAQGCIGYDTAMVIVSDCAALYELTAEQVTVAPNPSNGWYEVKFAHDLTVLSFDVTDLNGKAVVRKEPFTGASCTVDLRALENGIYLLHITTTSGEYQTKLLKQ